MPHQDPETGTRPLPASLPLPTIEPLILGALREDLGRAGDLTSQATLSPDATAIATMNARENGTIAGLDLAAAAFRLIGPGLNFTPLVKDGDAIKAGAEVASIGGNARALMSAERVALNFLNHMSGIATHTRQFVDAVAGTNARICDTRKTTPGLRAIEKYAVRCGGGANQRFGLDDAILIKDNHIAVAGGVGAAIRAARAYAGHMVAIEVEVDNLKQFDEALDAGATIVLLDNMELETLRKAVALNNGRAQLEASGGVDLASVGAIAQTGVDFISTSKITMASVPLDIGLDITIEH